MSAESSVAVRSPVGNDVVRPEARALQEATREILALDRMIHEPSRLAILTALRSTAGANYLRLHRLTGMSKGNLSNHLAKLEEAGLVSISKHFEGKRPVTTLSLTQEGRERINAYWEKIWRIAAARHHRKPTGRPPGPAR